MTALATTTMTTWVGTAVFHPEVALGYSGLGSTLADDREKTTNASQPALAGLYEKYAPAIFAHCRRFLPSPAAARDATQEAFVRVLARGVNLPREEEALRYLYRVSTNVCLNILREQSVHSRATPSLMAMSRHTASAESSHADREFVTAVLERCGEGGAQVAVMHYLDGMSQVEIAEVLGITRRTVFNRLRKLAKIATEILGGRSAQKGGSDTSCEENLD